MSLTSRSSLNSLLAVFVLSGFAGLIYQSIWSHYLGLFLGHAAYAQALVLAIFMGGMALGAALVSRAGLKWRNLIRTYAVIEAIIGLFALAFHWVFTGAIGLSYDTLIPALGQPWLIGIYKWLLAALLILPQTILLGMTFPLMSGGIIRRFAGRDGSVLGGLYFTNSIGAAIGVLVAAFILLPSLGLKGAMVVAGVLNILVAILAWWLGQGAEVARAEEPASTSRQAPEARSRLLRTVLIATCLSGAASFAYEIIWIRMLSLAVGSTLHAFELMLASFIAGIAFGGLWIRHRADTSADPLRLVGWMQIGMGLAALASLVFYASAFSWVGFLMQALAPTDGGYTFYNLGTALIAILIMMPAAFFAGTTLPLFTVALLRDGQGEASIGRVYAWNTLGAILGVFATIHFLIPALGLKLALILAALVDMFIGVILLRMRTFTQREYVGVGVGLAVVLLCTALSVLKVPFDPLRLSAGVFRSGSVELPPDDKIAFYRDGKTASVSVIANTKSGTVRIATNGKVDAAIRVSETGGPVSDEPTMVLAGALPFAYLQNPQSVGVIGFGSGLSTHTVLANKEIARVDTIEIEEAMLAGAQLFGERVERAYNDPRSNIVIDDAKSYFSGQQNRYDFILSEPSNPWISGVGSLFSQEFYRFIPKYLTDNGVFVQWLQLYEIDESLVASVLHALTPAFADYHAYLSNNADLIIIASQNRTLPEPDFAKLFTDADMRKTLAQAGITAPEQLAFRKVADARMLRTLARLTPARVNSDYFPVLSLNAPRTRFRKQSSGQFSSLMSADIPLLESLGISGVMPSNVPAGVESHFNRAGMTSMARHTADLLNDKKVTIEKPNENTLYLQALNFAYGLRGLSGECAEPWQPEQERLAVARLNELAERTIPYLPASDLEGVLINLQWQQCTHLPEAYQQAMAWLQAVAQRDHQTSEQLLKEWLGNIETRNDNYRQLDPMALAYLQLALIQQNKLDEAKAVEESLGKHVNSTGSYGYLRSLLLAWLDE